MKLKNSIWIILGILVVTGICTYFFHEENTVYNSQVVSLMKKENVYNKINKQTYSKTLESALTSNLFKDEYVKYYEKINYIDKDDFIAEVNTLLDKNYDTEEINEIYQNINDTNIKKLLTLDKVNLTNYYHIPNFEVDKIARYEAYQEKTNSSLEDAVIKVNIGLDHDFYTQIESISNEDEYTVLVNKYHSLGNYEPNDLKPLSYDSMYLLRSKAADAFEELVAAGKLENVNIRPYSAYRSYDKQTTIYNNYVTKDGKDEADTYSARPGHSEHQTGLAVDVWSIGYNYIKDEDAKWLEENSYKYGFIVRYTEENQNITGYIAEPWHLRYLGVDIATDVVDKNITYDEYYDLYIK